MDYKDFGLKIGIECHQQLEGHKLFCRCLNRIRDDKPDFTIKRFLRVSAGETGEKDIAAVFEEKKGKRFVYQGYNNSTCLVELDEEPPHEINKHALNAALQISLLLNCKINDVVDVMRKVVIDGSNTSGFQRTMLIGRDGFIDVNGEKIGINTVCLEEEACQIIERTNEYDIYNLSRLGIPLIEIATGPDIRSPEECREVAERLGMILRSVGGVKRGLGSIRQDINISVKNNERIEIKGFQDLRYIKKVIENEITRELELIKKGKLKSEVRKANPDGSTEFLRPMPGAARMYPETDVSNIKITKEIINKIILPELISEKIEKLEEKYKLNPDLARQIIGEGINFNDYLRFKLEPNFIARVLVEIPKEIKSRHSINKELKKDDFYEVLSYVEKGLINKKNATDALIEKLKSGKVNLNNYKVLNDEDLKKEIKKIIDKNKDKTFSGLMGIVMSKFKGKIDGKKAADTINSLQKGL